MERIKTVIPELKEIIIQTMNTVKNSKGNLDFYDCEEAMYQKMIFNEADKARKEIEKAKQLIKNN